MTLSPELVRPTEILVTLLGAAYAVLAARRNRLCWVFGAIASVLLGIVSFLRELPMQGALQVYYVVMAGYGWFNWTRASGQGELPVRSWPWSRHLVAALVLVPLSYLTAKWLASETQAAWPLLDSVTTWFSLLATWLAARAYLENWLYWIVIDGVLVYLYYMQDLPIIALQFAVFTGIALAGYFGWRRRQLAQAAPP